MIRALYLRWRALNARVAVENIDRQATACRCDLITLNKALTQARSRLALANAKVAIEEVTNARVVVR